MNPVIFYVDDEPHNLVVFEAACPETWTVRTFDNAMVALQKLDQEMPNVIVSDQRMPGMTGVQFLEVAKKLAPQAVRIIVTGYSDEDMIVESVRKAAIFDYIKKPWDVDDLINSITRAIELNLAATASAKFQKELEDRQAELKEINNQLTHALKDVELAKHKEAELRQELECWVPPFVMWAVKDHALQINTKQNVAGIAFDIIGSGELHQIKHGQKSVRAQVIQNFSESVLRHGGWRESHSGDSGYGHFGLCGEEAMVDSAAECALHAAREFRASLRSIGAIVSQPIECGIALHIARECPVHIHTVQLNTPRGLITQKSFDTSSTDVDLLHRMEKLVHSLPGSNIIMSRAFVDMLKAPPANAVELGTHLFNGQREPVELILSPGDLVEEQDLARLRQSLSSHKVTPIHRAA